MVCLRGSVLLPFKGKTVDVWLSGNFSTVDGQEPPSFQLPHVAPERFIRNPIFPRGGVWELKLALSGTLQCHAEIGHLSAGSKLLERIGKQERISDKSKDSLSTITVCA